MSESVMLHDVFLPPVLTLRFRDFVLHVRFGVKLERVIAAYTVEGSI